MEAALTQVTAAYGTAAADLLGAIPGVALYGIPVGLLVFGIVYMKRVFKTTAR